MVNRILLGPRSDLGNGAFVSKPGYEVTTCSVWDLIFSTTFESLQVLGSGALVMPGNGAWSSAFVWEDPGFYPMLLLANQSYQVQHQFLSGGAAQVRNISPPFSGIGRDDVICYWMAFRTPMP